MRVFSGQPQVPQHPAAIIREIHLVLAFPPDRSKVPGTNASLPSAVHQRPSASISGPGCCRGSLGLTQRRNDAKGDGEMRDCPRGFSGDGLMIVE
jgi:hypothetical protein